MKKPKIILHKSKKRTEDYGLWSEAYDPHYWYTLIGHNNKVFVYSETFDTKRNAIRSIKRLCERFGIVDFELIDKTETNDTSN